MYRPIAQRNWRRGIVALIAAYAIALSGLIASFAAANAAGAAVAGAGAILCHTAIDGQETPAPADHGKLCVDGCCGLGCAMAVAALPPPAAALPVALVLAESLAAPVAATLPHGAALKWHRSRAPPA